MIAAIEGTLQPQRCQPVVLHECWLHQLGCEWCPSWMFQIMAILHITVTILLLLLLLLLLVVVLLLFLVVFSQLLCHCHAILTYCHHRAQPLSLSPWQSWSKYIVATRIISTIHTEHVTCWWQVKVVFITITVIIPMTLPKNQNSPWKSTVGRWSFCLRSRPALSFWEII